MSLDRPFDRGLQPERTALAWQRTGLAMAVGALVATRILPELLGLWALLPGAIGLTLSIVVVAAAHVRYGRYHRGLIDASLQPRMPAGRLMFACAVTAGLIGILALVIAVGYAMGLGPELLP